MTTLSPREIASFQRFVLDYFHRYGRQGLPWRTDYHPYRILVSEIMLQQTQVDRVIPKFNQFLGRFPTLETLAESNVSEVIKHWQGLGYNRRGLNLQRVAQYIVAHYQGQLPHTEAELLQLPGIGPYTAAAIQAFAFNLPAVVIETNIRTIFISHFFHESYSVTDKELKPLIEQTLPQGKAREWYSALMDYGSYLKKVLPNPSRKSRSYVKQSPFQGSNRQIRGQILKLAAEKPSFSLAQLQALPFSADKLQEITQKLVAEGFLVEQNGQISLKS